MKALRQSAADYLALRRSLDFKLHRAETRLRQFLSFMKERKSTRVTITLALEFECAASPVAAGTMDPATETPPVGLLPARSRAARPYLYSEQEIIRLLEAAKDYPSWNRFPGPWYRRCRSRACACIFGLLAGTGMRIGEVLALAAEDID